MYMRMHYAGAVQAYVYSVYICAHVYTVCTCVYIYMQVLSKLVPIVIGTLKSPHEATRKKVTDAA